MDGEDTRKFHRNAIRSRYILRMGDVRVWTQEFIGVFRES